MIKEIIFKSIKSFSSEPISITFGKNVNVIIGPKGGGKSTLFDLLAGLKSNYISDNVIKALESYGLKFEKAIKFSNEEILFSQLSKKKKKEKEDDYKNRNDVIYQDDKIKKDLTSISEIDTNKFNYIKKQVDISHSVSQFVLEIKNLYNVMNKINEYFKNDVVNINWTNTFKIDSLIENDKLSLITKLDYKSSNIKLLIKQETDEYKMIESFLDEYNSKTQRLLKVEKNKIIDDKSFDKKLEDIISKSIENNNELIKLISSRKDILKKVETFSNIFQKAYKNVLDKVKSTDYSSSGLKNYETMSINHFKNLARDVFGVVQTFEKLISKEVKLSVENDINQKDSLTFQIPSEFIIDDKVKIDILKVIFYTPGSSVEDVTKWLKALTEEGIKDFKEDTIRNCISKSLIQETKVLVDFGNEKKDYESLSLGQKSIYGLKYKFNKSINDNIYLDQPEDNLDNNTIAQEILPMFEKKKDNQVVIVTHNANIGILTNPERVIIADLNNSKEPYKIANVSEIIKETSAYYLEGGKDFLESRYKKIIGK